MSAVALLTPEQLEDLVRKAVEPLRLELVQLREARASEARLMPLDDAARLLGVSRRTLQRRVAAGLLPSTHVGRALRVDVSSLLPQGE